MNRENIKERIVCAANWYDDGKVYQHQPRNIKSGFVVEGLRHHSIIAVLGQVFGYPSRGEEQGFTTTKNRFVTREEALVIALDNDQVLDISDVRGKRLHSEDLY